MKRFIISCLCGLLLSIPGFSQSVTTAGTNFWIVFTPNDNPNPTLSIFISSTIATSGNIYSAVPGVNQSFTVVPGIVTQVSIPVGVILSGGIENKGIQITANDPVTVYGLNYVPHSTDAFLALPNNALGLDYRVVTYTTVIAGEGSGFSVVATQNGTSLTILNPQTHLTTMINLDQGQTYFFDDPTLNDDLTGSRIQSNLPVAVFGFVKLVDIPAGCMAADYIVEEMFPYYSWGKNYLTVPLAGRDNSGDIFRVVAAEDGTDISINGIAVATINAGEYY